MKRLPELQPQELRRRSASAPAGGFPAAAWGVAASPRRLEVLRQQLSLVRKEAAAARRELHAESEACKELARLTEANKKRVLDLTDEEERCKRAPFLREASPVHARRCPDELSVLNALRTKTEELAREVSKHAALQLARCHALKDLRASARVTRLRRAARVAEEARGRLGAECRARAAELAAETEAAAALSARAAELRLELSSEVSTTLAVAEDPVAVLRSELTNEEQRQHFSDRICDARLDETQARLQRVNAEVGARLVESQVLARRLAASLQETECQEESLARRIEEARRKAAECAEMARAREDDKKLLEAELQQQRGVTFAWQSCATSLTLDQEDSARKAADAARATRIGSLAWPSEELMAEPEPRCMGESTNLPGDLGTPLSLSALSFLAPL